MKTHKQLDVWMQALSLVKMVYVITSTFPREEMFGLTSQMRRAAVSIQSNIAEGSGRSRENS
ncbi:four helix bundle protein [Vibrio furnissii]|uniref:four helix bundle protein n=1 Tax=Vibrio furnissii TaxID=29494 RepID=UPI001E3CDF57|nr:four helix bundle protein [Vibrio furnissii]UHJ60432.1 four helix bundle protein [Vibrio furnissii]